VKESWVAGIVIFAMLAASGFASSRPSLNQASYIGSTLEDAHLQYYEELRPMLIRDYASLTAMCDYSEATPTSPVK